MTGTIARVHPLRAYGRVVAGLSRNAKLYLSGSLLRSAALSVFELFFNLYLLGMGFDAAFIGVANTLLGVASIASSLPAGLIADRIGRKRAMLVGLAGLLITHLGIAFVRQGWAIIGFFVLYGLLAPLLYASIAPFLTENSTPQERAILFTLDSSLMNLAWSISTVGGGYLPGLLAPLLDVGPESTLAYRTVLLLGGAGLSVSFVPLLLIRERPATEARVRAVQHVGRRFSNPALLVKLVVPRLFFSFGAGLFFPFLTLFFKQRFAVPDATLGWIVGVTSALAVPTMLVGGAVAERLGKIRAAFVSRLISTPLLLFIGLAPSLPVAVAAHWIRGGFMRLGQPLYISFAMEQLAERERATGSSLLRIGWDAGWSLGPLVSGLLQARVGFTPLILSTVGLYAVGLGLIYLFFDPLGRKTEKPGFSA
jgi:MFS family permease